MARKRTGVFGAMGNLIRWTIWGLAGLFAIAIYLNWTKDRGTAPGSDEIAVLPPKDVVVQDAAEENAAGNTGSEADTPEDSGDGSTVVMTEAVSETEESQSEGDLIRIPGDEASYSLLNAFRRDDGAIEITTEKILGGERETTIRLVRCAPLEVGVIAAGDAPRNDSPEMTRIPLGSAAATLAATACGAMK